MSIPRSYEITNQIRANFVNKIFNYSSANKEFHMAIASIKAKMPNFYNKRKDFQSVLRSPACFDQLFDVEN